MKINPKNWSIELKACLVWMAMILVIILFTSTAKGHHMHVGEQIGSYLVCKTIEDADTAMEKIAISKFGDPEDEFAYQNFVSNSDNSCFDSRSMLPTGNVFLVYPIEMVEGHSVIIEGIRFDLWKVDFAGEEYYAWSAHEPETEGTKT